MRATVPTQITSVEDRLIGNLTIRQFMLLAAPCALFILVLVALPPRASIVGYKLLISGVVALIVMPMALRFKGKLLLDWFLIFSKFSSRPRYYVYDRNTSYLRRMSEEKKQDKKVEKQADVTRDLFSAKMLPQKERMRLQALIDQGLSVAIEIGKKGELHVIVTEKD